MCKRRSAAKRRATSIWPHQLASLLDSQQAVAMSTATISWPHPWKMKVDLKLTKVSTTAPEAMGMTTMPTPTMKLNKPNMEARSR